MRRSFRTGCAAVLTAVAAQTAHAQAGGWARMLAAADSMARPQPALPAPGIACGARVRRADSVEVGPPRGEFLVMAASLRTRGYFVPAAAPDSGSARFALHRLLCHADGGHPHVLELEHAGRYVYLVFSVRERPGYRALRFLHRGRWVPFAWNPAARSFGPRAQRPDHQLEVAAGDTFALRLPSNASTGYRWHLEEADSFSVALVRSVYRGSGRPIPGAGGSEHWTFRAIRPGEAWLRLVYARPGGPPAEEATYLVTVR